MPPWDIVLVPSADTDRRAKWLKANQEQSVRLQLARQLHFRQLHFRLHFQWIRTGEGQALLKYFLSREFLIQARERQIASKFAGAAALHLMIAVIAPPAFSAIALDFALWMAATGAAIFSMQAFAAPATQQTALRIRQRLTGLPEQPSTNPGRTPKVNCPASCRRD